MTKKKGHPNFAGLMDLDAPPPHVAGVVQRGATPPAEAPAPKRGRPSKDRPKTDPRPSFSLDPETHAAFKIWLLRQGVSMQDYLEEHIKALVRSEN